MKKLLALSISSILLTACGGGSDSGATKSTPTPTTPSIQNSITKLQINNPSIGQKLVFGNGALKADNIAGKKYYARYAYCPTHCSVGVNVGEMNFSLEKDGDNFKVSQNSVSVDKFGNIRFFENGQGGVEASYQPLPTGKAGLATSSLTVVDKATNRYKLTLTPAFSTEIKLPQRVEIDVYFDDSGIHLAGADDDYIFVAQQMATTPKGWASNANADKNSLAGRWRAYEIADKQLTVSATATLNTQTNNIIQDASPLQVNGPKGNLHGYYASRGSAFLFGYTDNNQPLRTDGDNYDNIHGLTLLAPDGQFGVSYDTYDDKSILIFR